MRTNDAVVLATRSPIYKKNYATERKAINATKKAVSPQIYEEISTARYTMIVDVHWRTFEAINVSLEEDLRP